MTRRAIEGSTPLDQYRNYLNDRERRCPECGYDDDEVGWQAETADGSIDYRWVCPRCENQQTRRLSVLE